MKAIPSTIGHITSVLLLVLHYIGVAKFTWRD
jgi:hypothetical protein